MDEWTGDEQEPKTGDDSMVFRLDYDVNVETSNRWELLEEDDAENEDSNVGFLVLDDEAGNHLNALDAPPREEDE